MMSHMSTQVTERIGADWRPADTMANRLVLLRREMHWTQREAAMACAVPYGSWQSLEDGRDARGLDRKISAIAAATGVDRDWLMWGGSLSGGRPSPTVNSGCRLSNVSEVGTVIPFPLRRHADAAPLAA